MNYCIKIARLTGVLIVGLAVLALLIPVIWMHKILSTMAVWVRGKWIKCNMSE